MRSPKVIKSMATPQPVIHDVKSTNNPTPQTLNFNQ